MLRNLRIRCVCIFIASLFVSCCAQIEHKQEIAEPVGRVITVPVGGTIATINKEKSLPNVFGRADLYGRKVDEGLIKIVYKGKGNDGSVLVEQIDIDVRSNASVFTRMPATYSTSSQSSVGGSVQTNRYGGYGTVTGQSTSSGFGMAPHAEQNIVLPPTATSFSVPKGKSLTLVSGQTIEFINIESHQITYRIVEQTGDR